MGTKKRTAQTYADAEISKQYSNGAVYRNGRVYSAFDRLKKRILREFPKKRLVGDIVINDEEFEILTEYLRLFYKYLRTFNWEICTDPLICVEMVQIGIRYYDGAYWPHFKHVLDNSTWNVTRQAIMGKVCVETLKAYGKYVPDENDRINAILLHGFVSNKYASNLMDFLYAYYRIDLERDLSRNDREMMRELIRSMQNKDNSNRTYKLVQQTSDAVSCNPRGCNIRLRWLLRLIDASFWEEEVRINPSNRLSRLFSEWAEQSTDLQRSRGRSGTRQKVFSFPHIVFDSEQGQFHLLLPSQLVRTDESVMWKCTIGDKERTIAVEAFESVLAYKTEVVKLPIPAGKVFEKISLSLEFGESTKRFVIPEERVRFFSKDGVSVALTSLKTGDYYAFSKEANAISSTALIESRRHEGLWFYYFSFEEGDIVKTIDAKAVSIGKKAEEGLLSRGIIRDAYEANGHLPIYSKTPSVLIKMSKSKLAGTAISINGNKFRLQDACELTEIALEDGTDNTGFWFKTSEIGCNTDGIYAISIDVPNDRSIREWQFVLLNGFDYSFDDRAPYIFESRGTIGITTERQASISPNSTGIEEDKESGFYNFGISSQLRTLEFSIGSIPVLIKVPQFEYSFDNVDWHTQKHSEIWHADLPRKLWIRMPVGRLSLELDNGEVNDEELRETFDKKSSEDLFECDITRFRSWINHEKIRNVILLEAFGKTTPFLEIISRSYVVGCLPEADFENHQIVIQFDIIGRSDYYVDLKYGREVIAEKVPLIGMQTAIPTAIHSGNYIIEVFESEPSDDFGFDDLYYSSIYREVTEIVNPRDLSGKSIEVLSIMRNEHDLFKMQLKHHYIIRGLKPLDEEGYQYEGQFYDRMWPNVSVPVVLELLEFEKLRYALINWIDKEYGEETEFLYDSYEKVLVCEEKHGLRSAERYRRYDCIFTDDFLYEIRVITQGR